MKHLGKKLVTLLLAAIMVMAMGVTAFAATSTSATATFYKDGKTTTSMANDAVAGKATVTVDGDVCHVSIPIKPIEYDVLSVTYTGYISGVTVSGATNCETSTPVYSKGTITFDVKTTLATLLSTKYDVTFEVVLYNEDGKRVGTPHDITELAPETISADLALTAITE